ncbi:uncharacterized protein LOC129943172 isoform X3 [Eupeodes corollae]|uniref:uncharacterized protein LOC129943172 isoform X2 n=1 Tax=Eupeodes corollae TaxID=290404 RepID=UPI002492ADB1|nr:uncharacterized protein LOC129943172 isoform X2 [Eupeodes corollae]XP_055908415.1 uncharacterized protein LOC129943172 isoform X3 [Eupeodes corollae]
MLRIETLLKCETVLKKLHAKIDKSDDVIPSKAPSNSTTNSISSNAAKKVHTTSSASSPSPSTKNKFVPNHNLIEIYTCPASPTHFGEVDFRPPVEIPTERRSSPVKVVSNNLWNQQKSLEDTIDAQPKRTGMISSSARFPNRSSDSYNQSTTNSHQKFSDAPKSSRWSDPRDRIRDKSPSSSSSSSPFHRPAWSSTSTGFSSANKNHRSQAPKKNESKYSSEEENWDEPGDGETIPKPKPDPKPTSSSTLTSSLYSSYKDSKNAHHHRHHDNKSYKSQVEHAPPAPVFPLLPDVNNSKEYFQNKIYHDTIYNYKKSDEYNSFMNPPAPEPRTQKHSLNNIFNRLGDKMGDGFENFRIQVKNDKIKSKSPSKQRTPPPPPPPFLVSSKPIGDVLKSPPLSADDIDDLLNESLEAATVKQNKAKSYECNNEQKTHSLDAVRKKLALISRPTSPVRLESPTRVENKGDEPFYRRGQTPTKKHGATQQKKELINPPLPPAIKNPPLPSPKSPPNEMDAVVERLALKYHPHKRRESVSLERNFQLQTEKTNTPPQQLMDSMDALGIRPNQSSLKESMVSPVHTVDPRISKKNLGQIPSLMSLPASPVPNVLPTINHFDPRLRNTLPLNKDHTTPFTIPKPINYPIPSLLDLHINIPIVPPSSLPNYNVLSPKSKPKPTRVDPRIQIPSKTYADKFNPERNDKTERMKYLESKRNKPPEPKTYGEYRQSKCRQQQQEGDGKTLLTTESLSSPVAPSIQSMVPSTLDKMYRSADYGKDIAGSIQGFKIPKKTKPEAPKISDPKKDDPVEAKFEDEPQKDAKSQEELGKKSDEDQLGALTKLEEPPKPKEKSIGKPSKQNDKNANKIQDVEPKTKIIPDTKKKKVKTKSRVSENPPEEEPKTQPDDIEKKKQTSDIHSQNSAKTDTKASEVEPDEFKTSSLDDSITESRLVIDEGESPIKTNAKDEKNSLVDDTESFSEPRIMRTRRNKNVVKEGTPSPEPKPQENPKKEANDVEEELKEIEKKEIKPRRISTRRSTIIMKELAEKIETKKEETPSETEERPRSASDIFSPTTDNSVVSTQNIISGKRRTRASINFNEKGIKKTSTPKATTSIPSASPTTQTTPKTRATKATEAKQSAAARKRNSISVEQRKDDEEKKNSEDGQICAVSSTTEGPHTEPAIISDTITSPEEPSSSNTTDQTTTPPAIVDADNKKKHDFLEGFLMSMADPTANKDRILDMLKSVLDETKLQQVKDILYSPVKSEEKNTSGEKDEEEEEEHQEQSKPRATRTKKNELDRLNEDIRDMFICQGVVTATGRRMCTIAKATTKKTSVQPKKKKVVPSKSNKSQITSPQPASQATKRPMRKAKVIISPLNIRALRSRNLKQNRSPKMPVLEPNTPIKDDKSQESDKEIEETSPKKKTTKNKTVVAKVLNKNLKTKPGPKSKRVPSDNSDSSDDDIELVFLKDKIKRMDGSKNEEEKNKELKTEKTVAKTPEKEEIQIDSTKKEPKTDIKNNLETEVSNESTVAAVIVVASEDKPKEEETLPKNTNPEFHTKSEYSNCCVICKEKNRYIAPHYRIAHNDSEVYTSRLPPDVLEDVKLNINNSALFSLPKKPQAVFNYTCPFCDFQSTHTLRGWMEHFTIHTGEYGHKCSKCFKAMNGSTHMMEHIKKFCPDAKKINRDPINLRGNGIFGYVCHLCNFTQMLRGGVVQHLKVHHDLDDAESIKKIIEVKLIDTASCAKKELTDVSSTSLTDTTTLDSSTVVENKPSDSNMTVTVSNKEPVEEDDVIVLSGSSTNTNSEESVDKKKTDDDEEDKSRKEKESSMSTDSNMEVFVPSDLDPPVIVDLTEQSQVITDESESGIKSVSTLTFKPTASENKNKAKQRNIEVNIEVFIPRERLASPTSMTLSERWKSMEMEKDDEIASDSVVSKTKPAAKKMTIAEKLSQRFKNIEKQNSAEGKGDVITDKNINQTIEKESNEVSCSIASTHPEEEMRVTPSTSEKEATPLEASNSPAPSQPLYESGNLIMDEQVAKQSSNRGDDYCSESDDCNEIEEDDNENWEDIEITETTKSASQKEKNKNKSIFQTLSRLYASIAPKRTSKKMKEKEKEKKKVANEALERSEKNTEKTAIPKTNSIKALANESVGDSLLLPASSKPTQPPIQSEPQARFPNLSEFLPDSPGDSLDMLLSANFNCLEGDGSSFPQLDLNDLDSSIFPLPEEQENIQDAIEMATDMEHNKYDVLGNPISLSSKTQQQQISFLPPTTTSIHRIGNFGFSLNGNSLKYYCMVKSCAFLFSDHPDGLQNHFLLEHTTLKWNGYCDTCKMQVGFGDHCREMQHMLDVHSRIRTEDSGDKPRIKFRRLTGDILSTDKQNEAPFSPFKNVSSNVSPFHDESPQFDASPSMISSQQGVTQNATSHNILPAQTPELSLSSMLQSEPRAMIPPKAPPQLDMDIPLFKNVSKEFTITNVAEGVTDSDLLNLVFKQADSAPGGIQISQVISLNAGGKSVSPLTLPQISDRNERRNSPAFKEIRETEKQSPRASPNSIPMNSTTMIHRNSPLLKNPVVKQASFVCCVNKCNFTANMRTAMNEHILSHLRYDNNRDALRCNLCSFIGQDTNHYFNHMTQVHLRRDVVATSCASTVELTQKIQDILRTTSKTNQPNESLPPAAASVSVREMEKDPAKATVPVRAPVPLKVPVRLEEKTTTSDNSLPFSKRLRKTAEEIVAPTGLPEELIWRCIFYPDCKCTTTEKDFQTHLSTHTSIVPTSFPCVSPGSSLHCPHCPVNYYRAAVLKAHMKTHARHQYFCNACSCMTFSSFQQVQKHFTETHSLSGVPRTRSLIPDEKSNNPVLLLASETELSSNELIQFGEKLMGDWERRKALNKTHFKPNEQNLLPIQPIFNNQVYCSVCNYKTKVRTNMFRHLQLHNQDVDVGSVDPVNPVPCLEKNEKHFDKMLNLACSSNTLGSAVKPKESVKIPAFVPDMRRYVCGHPGCKYLTITDQMFRSHLNALHGQEKGYLCPHCQEEICKKNMCAERVVQHLKFHGNKIYQCSECDYFHYTKHVVERHVNEKHSSVSLVNLITFDRSENETKKSTQPIAGKNVSSSHSTSIECDTPAESPATTSTPPNTKMKWECALCKHQTATWNQMISHANSMHSAKHQYHCVHCSFGSAHLAHIMDHIDNKHPSKIREAKYVFYKINETPQDKAADTRPLWSRNDPKRVRSIRGILMENEEDAERTKKSLSRAGVDLDDEDEEVIAPVSDSDASVIPGGLACFHCNYTSLEISSLNQHWKSVHWHEKNSEMVPRLPFFFRIHTVLKCPLCPHVGDQITLKIHLINVHGQRNFCAADPNVPNTCGHCPFVYPTKRLDVLTNHYLREHKPTDAKNLSSGLLRNLLALGECQVYMQCYFCAEICADKTSIIEHERERHKNSNLRYKQIKDEVIYRCGMCQYSSTNELATLRHMIDHFAGFNVCHFCKSVQSSFNSYMQHCYTFHIKSLTSFKEIYSFEKIATFLGQMLLIFPNGLIAAKANLLNTQYGNTERVRAMYDEICKKALEPPIPPLCMGRLLAKKSMEASTLLPPPPVTVTAKRIAKRRSTVAMGGCEERGMFSNFLVPSEPQKIKKRKSSICGDFQQPTAPLFSTITTNSNNNIDHPAGPGDVVVSKTSEPQGFSFYGQKPDPIDLSRIYTHIAIGDKYAPVSVKKFSLLFKINTKVVVEAMDFRNYHNNKRPASFSRPCPASKKKKFV